jgi:hypothetical protein
MLQEVTNANRGRSGMMKAPNSELTNFLLLTAGGLAALSFLMSLYSMLSTWMLLQKYGGDVWITAVLRSIPWLLLWAAIAYAGFRRINYLLPVLVLLTPLFLVFAIRPLLFRANINNITLFVTLLVGAALKLSLSAIGIVGTITMWKASQLSSLPRSAGEGEGGGTP